MIKIYDINDNVLMMAEVTSAAVRVQELSKSDYIQLSFYAAKKVILPVGAYIEYTYKIDKVREVTRKFLLLESYEPTQSNESSWKYTPEFQHPKMILSKTPFYISTYNSQKEKIKQNIWSFVGTIETLSGKIADFLNKDIKFGNCGWVCDMTTVTANTVNVSFSDNDFISALSAIANAIGDNCEWHIDYDNETIYIGKIVLGDDSEVLEVGKNVGVPSITSSRESYYNAFSVFGGTRNITQKNEKEENVSSGDIRLQLSAGTGSILIDGKERAFTIDEFSTIDLREDKEKEPLFTKVLDFSDIFPSLNTYVYDVRGREKYVLDDNNKKIPVEYNSDGSVKAYKTFTVWYMRLAYPTTEKISGKSIINTTVDDGVTHYWYDFEITDDLLINGKNIGCSFEANFANDALSTPLAGRGTNGDYVGFELTYHDKDVSDRTSDDVSEKNFSIKTGDYEIIYQEDNDIIIPSNAENMLIPRGEDKPSLKCNITVLYNIAMKESVYTQDAQKRLLEAAKKEIIRLLSDLNNYSVKSYPQVFVKENPCLQIAQAITYKDGNGYSLESRVLKLETNLDYDFVQTITVGNQTIKGTTTQLREDVQKIIANGGGNGGGSTYTAAQLSNLISKYGTRYFLSKQFDDTAAGTITFEKIQKFLAGLTAEKLSQFKQGATFGDFISSILIGTGARIDELGNGEFESITSRSAIIAKELIVNRQTAIESNFYTTESGVVENVTEIPATTEGGSTTYELKLQKRWENDFTAFHEQDCIRASINTLMADGKYYDMWLRVLSVNAVTNTITVVMYPDDEVPSQKNYPPVEMARLIRWGNPVDETRQRLWYLSAESGTIILLNHVRKPIIDRSNYSIAIGLLPDALTFVFQDFPNADPNDGAIYTKWIAAEQFVYKDYEGNVKQNVIDRGLWSLDTAKGDSPYRCISTEVHDVWHYGCRWRCLNDKTTLEPMYSSQGWAFVEGNPTFEAEMTSSNGWDFDCDTISARDDNGNLSAFTTLGFNATLYNRNVNEHILAKNVVWTRDTGRTNEDDTWAVQHADAGFSVPITWEDLGTNAQERWKCTFKVKVTIIDETASTDTQQARTLTTTASVTLGS